MLYSLLWTIFVAVDLVWGIVYSTVFFDVFDLKVIKSNCKRPAGVHKLVLRPRKLVLLYVLNSSTITTSASPLP